MNILFHDKRGFALVTAISVSFLVSILSAAVYTVAHHQLFAARKTREYLKAKVIAEAGANDRYNQVKYNFDGFGTSAEMAYGGGSYQTILESVGSDRARLISIGRCGESEARIDLSLRNFPVIVNADNPDSSLPEMLEHAIAVEGDLKLHGMYDIEGDVAYGDKYTKAGNAGTLNGTAGPTSQKISDWFDVTDYTMHPDTVVWDGSTPLSSYPAGTIVYYNGNITVNSGPVSCCLIAQGDIKITSHVKFNRPGTYPTLVSINGDIDLHGGPTIDGLIVALDGTVSRMSGGGGVEYNIKGAIAAKGDLTFGGGFKLIYDADAVNISPPGAVEQDDRTVVIAWQ